MVLFIGRDKTRSFKVTLFFFVLLVPAILLRMKREAVSQLFSDPPRLALTLALTFICAAALVFIGRALLWLVAVWGESRKQKVTFGEFAKRPQFDENLYAEYLAKGKMKWW